MSMILRQFRSWNVGFDTCSLRRILDKIFLPDPSDLSLLVAWIIKGNRLIVQQASIHVHMVLTLSTRQDSRLGWYVVLVNHTDFMFKLRVSYIYLQIRLTLIRQLGIFLVVFYSQPINSLSPEYALLVLQAFIFYSLLTFLDYISDYVFADIGLLIVIHTHLSFGW